LEFYDIDDKAVNRPFERFGVAIIGEVRLDGATF
jgi:hypothetical protein